MTIDRLHTMLQMISDATGGSASNNQPTAGNGHSDMFNYALSISELRQLLLDLIDREIIECVNGEYYLANTTQ